MKLINVVFLCVIVTFLFQIKGAAVPFNETIPSGTIQNTCIKNCGLPFKLVVRNSSTWTLVLQVPFFDENNMEIILSPGSEYYFSHVPNKIKYWTYGENLSRVAQTYTINFTEYPLAASGFTKVITIKAGHISWNHEVEDVDNLSIKNDIRDKIAFSTGFNFFFPRLASDPTLSSLPMEKKARYILNLPSTKFSLEQVERAYHSTLEQLQILKSIVSESSTEIELAIQELNIARYVIGTTQFNEKPFAYHNPDELFEHTRERLKIIQGSTLLTLSHKLNQELTSIKKIASHEEKLTRLNQFKQTLDDTINPSLLNQINETTKELEKMQETLTLIQNRNESFEALTKGYANIAALANKVPKDQHIEPLLDKSGRNMLIILGLNITASFSDLQRALEQKRGSLPENLVENTYKQTFRQLSLLRNPLALDEYRAWLIGKEEYTTRLPKTNCTNESIRSTIDTVLELKIEIENLLKYGTMVAREMEKEKNIATQPSQNTNRTNP